MIINSAKELFEDEANEYDAIIPKLIPFYDEICTALIKALPFKDETPINVLDLGCGTGTIAKKIKIAFPNSRISCLDFAPKMLQVAKNKLNEYKSDIKYIVSDFNHLNTGETYDVVVSSFAIHHIPTNNKKAFLYRNIYDILNQGGVFYNADVVLASCKHIQSLYLNKWGLFANKGLVDDRDSIELLEKYQKDDNPSVLMDQIKWLEKSGFKEIDVIWKYYNFAVYGGKKIL